MQRFVVPWLALAFLLLPLLVVPGRNLTAAELGAASSTYRIRSSVIGAAGYPGESAGLKTNGTLGQPTAIGVGSAAGKTAYLGFWGRYWIPTPVEDVPPAVVNRLYQNYPNPFNPATTIRYSVSGTGYVEISIFTVKGERITTLVKDTKPPGTYKAVWDGRNTRGAPVSSGIYFYRLRAGSFTSVRKMLLMR